MQIQVAVAKIGKHASSESGDSLEMIERPHGGLSFVLADGQRSGKSAKAISHLVASKAIALLAEGVRDGAAARATHDYLYLHRRGQVSATLNIVSVDMETKTLVISRNSHCPVIVQMAIDRQIRLDDPTPPIGVQRSTKPQISELPLQVGMVAVIYTDGVQSAGEQRGQPVDIPPLVAALYAEHWSKPHVAQAIADALLAEALCRDEGRPRDDMSVLVVAVTAGDGDEARRLSVTFPVPPLLRP